MARVADHVYDHVLAVCRSASVARDAAVAALARSPRSLAGALGHARPFALDAAAAAAAAAVDDDGGSTGAAVPEGLLELAWLLAGTRPVHERSVVDLAVRHDLDRVGLGRALATSPSAAGAEADAALERWEHDLRPALVAFLGPAGCDGLRAVLAEAGLTSPEPPATSPPTPPSPPAFGEFGAPEPTEHAESLGVDDEQPVAAHDVPSPPTVDALLAVAPAVAAHVERCDVCPDRVRAMAPLRSLLAQVPIAVAPPALAPAAGRRRRSPSSPSIDAADDGGHLSRSRGGRRVALATVAAVVVLVVAGAATVTALARNDDDRVALLTRVPAHNALAAVPDEIHPGQVFLLESTVDHAVHWEVRSPVTWLRVEPASGVLAARRTSEVQVHLDDAPEGELRTDLAVTGDDGSTVLVRVRGSVEHPPTVAAAIDGCTVTAQVEDESEIASVELRWMPGVGGERSRPMASAAGGYRATLPSAATTWWVTAVDGRGNRATSPERTASFC